MVPPAMPKSLIVMGSGAIGIEFASFYRTMGAEVTVIELLPQILPVEDAEIAGLARKRFEKQGIKILTGAKVTGVEKGADSVTATVDDGKGGTAEAHRRAADLGRRRRLQHRGARAGEARGEGRARRRRHRRLRAHQRPRHLRHRRRRRRADARPQGGARGRDLRRDHRRQARPPDGQGQDPGLHLLPPADRLRRASRRARPRSRGST